MSSDDKKLPPLPDPGHTISKKLISADGDPLSEIGMDIYVPNGPLIKPPPTLHSGKGQQAVNDIFIQVVEIPEEKRQKFIEHLQLDDTHVLEELNSLLAAHGKAGGFLEEPLVQSLTKAFVEMEGYPQAKKLRRGDKIDGFEILDELGVGGAGTVYLARQISLGRKVALKVTVNRGEEAQILARLEHDNIVKVYSEHINQDENLRVICMQLVPGMSLQKIIEYISVQGPGMLAGDSFINSIEDIKGKRALLGPAAMKERVRLENYDYVEAILFLTAQLSQALAYAHQRKVLHLDVKPANILLTPSGRPLLADFNISRLKEIPEEEALNPFGGTEGYMAPEHVAAFEASNKIEAWSKIDARADVYSMGIVLKELMKLWLPDKGIDQETRRKRATLGASGSSELGVGYIIERCTQRKPEKRFQTAADLARALEGLLEFRGILKRLSPVIGLTKLSVSRPLMALSFFVVLPQLLGSFVNIFYNSLHIVDNLSLAQAALFKDLLLWFNPIVYAVLVALWIYIVLPLKHYLRHPSQYLGDPASVKRLRRHALRLTKWVIGLTAFGWGAGAIFFPLMIHIKEGPIAPSVFLHFLTSFALSWAVAMAYSYLYVQFVVIRSLYPKMWLGCAEIRKTADVELKSAKRNLQWMQYPPSLCPILAAAMILIIGPERYDGSHYQTFMELVVFLLGVGVFGIIYGLGSSRIIAATLAAFSPNPYKK